MLKKSKTQTRAASDDQILEFVGQNLSAKQICEKAGLTKGTLRRRLYELSIKQGKLIEVQGLFGSAPKTEFEIRKSGSLIIPSKVLEAQGYKQGQRFQIEFSERQITLSLI